MFSVGEGNMFWSLKKVDSEVKSGPLLVFALLFSFILTFFGVEAKLFKAYYTFQLFLQCKSQNSKS